MAKNENDTIYDQTVEYIGEQKVMDLIKRSFKGVLVIAESITVITVASSRAIVKELLGD